MSPSHTSQDAGREPSVRVVRRQLITAHGAKEMPTPRVVLHLPDLDALQTVALGPVRPSGSRRRVDSAHDVEPTAKRTTRKQETKDGDDKAELPPGPLLNLLRVPLKKWLTTEGAGKLTAGSLVVLMQQPKVMLGAIVALGMQLAAILAMLGGGGSTADKSANPSSTPGGDVAHSHTHDSHRSEPRTAPTSKSGDQHAAHERRPIQTPLNALTADGKPFAGPSLLPAPQALSGIDPKDLPPWQAPVTNLPTPSATPSRNATIAAPSPSPSAAPVFAGPNLAGPGLTGATEAPASLGTANIAIGLPESSGATVSNTPNPATSGPTNVVQTSGARAKLKGTIRKPSGAN